MYVVVLASSVDAGVWCWVSLVLVLGGGLQVGGAGVRFIREKVGSRNLYLDRVGAKNKWVFLPVRDEWARPRLCM